MSYTNFEPKTYQKRIWEAVTEAGVERSVWVAPRRSGKTILSLCAIIERASDVKGSYAYIDMNPSAALRVSLGWRGSDGAALRGMIDGYCAMGRDFIRLPNGSEILFTSPDQLYLEDPWGKRFDGAVINEPWVWGADHSLIVKGFIKRDGWVLVIGTKTPINITIVNNLLAHASTFRQCVTIEDADFDPLSMLELFDYNEDMFTREMYGE